MRGRLVLGAFLIASPVVAAGPPDIAGMWTVHQTVAGNTVDRECTFVQTWTTVTGTCKDGGKDVSIAGRIDGATVAWQFGSDFNGTALTLKYTGTLNETGTVAGSVEVAPFSVTGEFSARRAGSAAQSASPVVAKAGANADPLFNAPFIDKDEWRQVPVRHRYVHGGFTGTEARFSFYFPEKDRYQRRFFQFITPAPASENLAQQATGVEDVLSFAVMEGGYLVETNEGGLKAIAGDQTIPGYRVNAASAEYSRVLAAEMYGPHRPFGYAFGGSGGGFKTISGFENTDTWDGVVPFVIGSPMALPNVFTVRVLAQRVLKDKFAAILDAIEPGGSGDMYAGLDAEQRAALREVTKMGFPPKGWFNYQTLGQGAFTVMFPIVRMMDGKYFTDFWTQPGYEGADPGSGVSRARVQYATTVKRLMKVGDLEVKAAMGGVDTAWQRLKADFPIGYELESVPPTDLDGAFLVVKSGKDAGQSFQIGKVVGKMVFVAFNPFGGDPEVPKNLAPGDQVQIDNSDLLAAQFYHRHQVPTPDFYVWDQFRGADGKPLFAQRPMLLGPMLTGAGSVQSGRFKGKMIVLASLMDQDALPWQADWYRTKVKDALGDRLDERFRLYFTENAIHADGDKIANPTHTVNYLGTLHQAIHDLSAWVEKGAVPPPSTQYRVVDGQIVVPSTAAERHGLQPVVHLSVNGGVRADVAAGAPCRFDAEAEMPPNTGTLVSMDWDFEGTGTFPDVHPVRPSQENASGTKVTLTATHAFAKPGTYFAIVRATSQRIGQTATPFGRIQNIARVRVVVQ